MMFRRRLIFALLAGALALLLSCLILHAFAGPGAPVWRSAAIVCALGLVPWSAISAAHSMIGLVARRPPWPVADLARLPRIMITVVVRNESMAAVLPPLRRLLDELDALGCDGRFSLALLSDTQGAADCAQEARALRRFRAGDPAPERILYRRRIAPTGYKSGNLLDFLDTDAASACGGHEFALVLDADSAMSAEAVLRLVGMMQADPWLAIAQHLTTGRPARTALARIFQFGMHAGMHVWANGQAWWQGDCGPFWGHNALLRIAPFRAHARLAPLPDGSRILSHDQVEGAALQKAGWGVRLMPTAAGSFEAHPPTLIDFLARDRRWLTGNLQYRYLLGPGRFGAMGRWQLAQAMLMFLGAPAQLGLMLVAAGATATGAVTLHMAPLAETVLAWAAMQHAPRLAGYAALLAAPQERARLGRARRFAAGMAIEIVFSCLLDPICCVERVEMMAAITLGRRTGWPRQSRDARAIGWSEALRRFWPHTLLGLVLLGLTLLGGFARAPGELSANLLWVVPFIGGLPLAVPLAVLTAESGFSAWLRRQSLCAAAEEPARESRQGRPLAESEPLTVASII